MIKKIKLDEFLRCCGENSADVSDDYNSDWVIAYCGDGLTEAGRKIYQPLLDLEVEWDPEAKTAKVLIDHLENARKLSRMLSSLFIRNAGYCDNKFWEKMFL